MTTIAIDLAELLEAKLQHGFSIQVSIDIADSLEYADDHWEELVDLDHLLEARHEAALVITASQVLKLRPHLTHEQAWDVARVTRDQTQDMMDDFITDVADLNYPTAKYELQRRAVQLKLALKNQTDGPAEGRRHQLEALRTCIDRIPDRADVDPAWIGSLAASLDDLERLNTSPDATNTERNPS